MNRVCGALTLVASTLVPGVALATPTTTYWAPSTASCQGYLLPHVNVSLLVGPVFFLDSALQPGGRKHLWTAQLDVDIPLGK